MNLKKSDKIIAVAGVIILIIAGISIAVIISSEEEEKEEEEVLKEEIFYVTWTKETGEMPPLKGTAEKIYNEPFTVTAPAGSVLTNVEFRLTWQDDHITGLILKRFKDTLKAEISPEGGETKSHTSEGGCTNEAISFNVNDMSMVDSVEANDTFEAGEIINEMIFGQDSASFDVKVTVNTGEKLRRPLKFFRDKGNSFELKITYEYYSPQVEEEYGEDYSEEENGAEEEGYEYQGILGRFYRNLCYGRSMI